jgi:alpha-glucosidase (family GH31 glycosyl hydrolase)
MTLRSTVTVALVLLVALAAPAHAAVEIGPDRVTVSTTGARAVIERAPLRIAFDRGSGSPVLQQLPNERIEPQDLPRTQDPEPYSLEREPDNAAYAPLTFEVGAEERAQWTGVYWAGDMLFSRRQGTVYAARDVLSATPNGEGVDLVVSTNDPSGRLLLVNVAPDTGPSIRVQVRPSTSDGVISMADSFASSEAEAFRGFGGRHAGLNHAGRKLYGWVEQENFGGPATLAQVGQLPALTEAGTPYTFEELGVPPIDVDALPGGRRHYLFPGGPGGAYYVQASFLSSNGYGFLLNRDELSRWRMKNDRDDAWQVQASAPALDYTVAPGGPRKAMRTLTSITGRHQLPAAWAQGATISRPITNNGQETPETYKAKVEADLRVIERRRPPIKLYAFEGWGIQDPEWVRSTIRRLHRMDIKAQLYLRAYVSDDELLTQPSGDYDYVRANGLVATDANGEPAYFRSGLTNAPAVLLDFTDPATQAWWRDRIELMLDLGADGFMQDFGEQTLDEMRFHDGSTGAAMHNRYPVLYHRLTRELVDDYERRHDRQIFWFTRSGYSGRPGSTAYEESNFPGDETSDWSDASGLRSLAPDMLNRAIGGAFGFNDDIGGYASLFTGPPGSELFTRWSQWSALVPFFRVHSSAQNEPQFPWSYDSATYARWRAMARLHNRAIPYMQRLWRAGRRTGMPPTRPLWLAYPGDRRAAGQEQQWLLGPDVLVAPVVERGARARHVYFPRGCWRSPDTGKRYRGPASRRVRAPLGRLPYFFRCGKRPFDAP